MTVVEKIKTHTQRPVTFFPHEMKWKNTVESNRPQITYTAYALCVPFS